MGTSYLLALDLGVTSIGWALLGLDEQGNPNRIIRVGTHLFEAGSTESDFERGKDEPPGKPRRDARQLRKMIWRRARRKRKLLRLLQSAKLLPPGDVSNPAAIDAYIKSIDADLAKRWNRNITHREHQLLPYRIRAAALDRDLAPVEFGRALYHLAQRRGFKSNRKSKEKPDEKSVVKSGISELAQEMAAKGSRTLGEYFASIDPEQVKLRRRWTSREMYTNEFDQLWTRQGPSLGLTDAQRDAIREAIFDQRPLKPMDHLIGRCRHMPNHRRAPMACRLFQRFRMLQKVNDLRLVPCVQVETPDRDKDGQVKIDKRTGKPKNKKEWVPNGDEKPLTHQQRQLILDRLAFEQTVTLAELRKLIDAPKDHRFNFETRSDESEKSLPGHKTDTRLAAVVPGYKSWPEEKKTDFVDELLGSLEDDKLRDRLRAAYQLAPDVVEAVLDVGLEDDYASLSRAAMRKLLPRMEQGENYMIVARELFPDEFKPAEPVDRLPPVMKFDRDLRNPTVLRGLTEVRKLVNLVIKRYGKPQRIHIELLRQLKQSRDARAEQSREIDARQKLRKQAADRIVREVGVARANARDIEKWLLAEECGWICPYTGKAISVHSLFVEPEFEIEHIYPYALSLDDSFANKTLCHRDANREKGRRLPSQAFSKQRLEEILQRVARFNGDLRDAKLRRFKATEIPEGFTNRQLNDSSHLARAASQYLGLLYGGVNDSAGTKRIHTRVGGLTAQVRRLWGLNQILSGTDEKTREDHRHHAIDAVVVGCTDTRTVQEMMRVASEQITFGRSRLSELPLPFPDFFPQLVDAIEKVVVSHRQSRKVGGKLHAETLYSRPIRGHDGGQRRHVRWPWSNFVRRDQLDLIVDPRLRACVIEQYEKSAKPKPADAFKEHPPVWMMKDGRTLPIRAVRVAQAVNPRTIGKGPTQRFVESTQGSNHHVRILAELRPDGTEKTWLGKVFTRFDVLERRRQRLPDVNRETETGYAFKFSLAGNEYVEIDDPDATGGTEKRRVLYRVVAISQDKRGSTRLRLVRHNDGRTRDDRKKAGQDWEPAPSTLFALHARKVFVNYLGEVKGAGG